MKNNKIESIQKNIINLFDDIMTTTGVYNIPYSEDDYVNFSVSYKINRAVIWETINYSRCKYSGTIYLSIIDVIVGSGDDREKMDSLSDLPSWVEDDIKDEILDEIEKWLPNVCVDVDIN